MVTRTLHFDRVSFFISQSGHVILDIDNPTDEEIAARPPVPLEVLVKDMLISNVAASDDADESALRRFEASLLYCLADVRSVIAHLERTAGFRA